MVDTFFLTTTSEYWSGSTKFFNKASECFRT